MWTRFPLFALLLATSATFAQEAAPNIILNYQGVLTDPAGVPVPDGEYDITFRIYPSVTGGTAQWTEPHTLQLTRGVFQTTLGLNEPIPPTIDFSQRLWLSIRIEGSGELSPRLPLSGTPYALHALTVAESSITASSLVPGAVRTEALAPGAVTGEKIGPGAIDSSRVGIGALSGRNLAASTIIPAQIDISGAEEGQTLVVLEDELVWTQPVPGESIREVIAGAGLAGGGTSPVVTIEVSTEGIQTDMLADGAVADAKIAPNAVGTQALGEGSVTASKIAPSAVGTASIADGAVTGAKLAPGIEFLPDGAVTTVKLADGAVTGPKIANQSVGTTKIDPAGGGNGDVLGIQGNRVVWLSLRSMSEEAAYDAAAKTVTETTEGNGPTGSTEVSELRDRLSRSEAEISALRGQMRILQEQLDAIRLEMGR